MLTPPTTAELATFSGRGAATFGPYAAQAIEQATLMFSVLTRLPEYPEDPDMAQLAKNAILEMADRLILEQPHQAFKASPFSSETMMSYSYTRATQTATNAQNGLKTGLFWWDVAIDELTVAGQSLLGHGSIRADLDGLSRDDAGMWMIETATQDLDRPPYIRIS